MYRSEDNWVYGYKELIIRHLDRLSSLSTRTIMDNEETSQAYSEDIKINSMVWGIEFLQAILPKEIHGKIPDEKKKPGDTDVSYLARRLRLTMNECAFIYDEDVKEVMTFGDEVKKDE